MLALRLHSTSKQENTHQEVALLVAGDFNAGKFKSILPHFYQHFPRGKKKHDSNTIIKFVDDNDETDLLLTGLAVQCGDLAVWCQDNNLSLNVSKTKEMIVDYRKYRQGCSGAGRDFQVPWCPPHQLSWSKHTMTVVKKAQQHLFHLRRLKRFVMGPQILKRFYSCRRASWRAASLPSVATAQPPTAWHCRG